MSKSHSVLSQIKSYIASMARPISPTPRRPALDAGLGYFNPAPQKQATCCYSPRHAWSPSLHGAAAPAAIAVRHDIDPAALFHTVFWHNIRPKEWPSPVSSTGRRGWGQGTLSFGTFRAPLEVAKTRHSAKVKLWPSHSLEPISITRRSTDGCLNFLA
jgi:hypothetical protein